MPTNAITIDNFGVEFHERYASDQTALDTKYIDEVNLISAHLEIPGSECAISTKWEDLFETNLGNQPWANFGPPPELKLIRNRFFSNSISPNFDWAEEQEDEQEDEEQAEQLIKTYRKKIKEKKSKYLPISLLEKDKTALLNLLGTVDLLNGFLREVHSRKLQYQKG